jgi:hypothetical protein
MAQVARTWTLWCQPLTVSVCMLFVRSSRSYRLGDRNNPLSNQDDLPSLDNEAGTSGRARDSNGNTTNYTRIFAHQGTRPTTLLSEPSPLPQTNLQMDRYG